MERNLSFFIRIEKLRAARKREKASEKEIYDLLKKAYEKRIIFKSQSELIKFLRENIKNKNLPLKKVIREIAIRVGYKIKYFTKRTRKEYENCPVCGKFLSKVTAFNIKKESIILEYVCKFCKFKTKDKKDLPIKFKFIPQP